VTHIGGASAKTVGPTSKANQIVLWSMRSQYIYYRKHHGLFYTWMVHHFEMLWHRLRVIKNYNKIEKKEESLRIMVLLKQAWRETRGGSLSPARPW
jgi:hypothetical protein